MKVRFALVSALLILAFSCKKPQPATTFKEVEVIIAPTSIVSVVIPKAEGNPEVSKNINQVITETIGKALMVADSDPGNWPLETLIDNFDTAYQNFKADFPESEIAWEAQIDGEVLYQSPEVITIALTIYTNTGGAHGITSVRLLNFDAVTGQLLPNEKLISKLTAFETLVKTRLEKEVAERNIDVFDPKSFTMPQNIGFNNRGVILLYNQYEIAPYASGIIDFEIPYEEAEDLLTFDSMQ